MPQIGWDALVQAAGDAGKAFEPLPNANYDFVVSEAVCGESKTGKKSINITAIVESGPHAKRKVWNTWYISPESPGALAYFFREMAIFGLDMNFFVSKPTDETIIANLVNKRFIGTLTQAEFPAGSGKIKNEFDGFLAPIGSPLGNAQATIGSGGGSSAPSVPSVPTASAVPSASPTPVVAPAPVAAAPVVDSNPWVNNTVAPPAPPLP